MRGREVPSPAHSQSRLPCGTKRRAYVHGAHSLLARSERPEDDRVPDHDGEREKETQHGQIPPAGRGRRNQERKREHEAADQDRERRAERLHELGKASGLVREHDRIVAGKRH